MNIIVIASQKGGAGKTTLAAHLAVEAGTAGHGPVVLIDTDPQASLAEWWNSREAEEPLLISPPLAKLPAEIQRLRQAGAKLIVIDTPPAMTSAIAAVIRLADLVIVPVKPSPHDFRAVVKTVDMIQAEKKQFVFVVSQAKGTARLTGQAAAVLSEYGPVASTFVGDRVDFASSMIDGRTVQEMTPKAPSAGEIKALLSSVMDRLNCKKQKDQK